MIGSAKTLVARCVCEARKLLVRLPETDEQVVRPQGRSVDHLGRLWTLNLPTPQARIRDRASCWQWSETNSTHRLLESSKDGSRNHPSSFCREVHSRQPLRTKQRRCEGMN